MVSCSQVNRGSQVYLVNSRLRLLLSLRALLPLLFPGKGHSLFWIRRFEVCRGRTILVLNLSYILSSSWVPSETSLVRRQQCQKIKKRSQLRRTATAKHPILGVCSGLEYEAHQKQLPTNLRAVGQWLLGCAKDMSLAQLGWISMQDIVLERGRLRHINQVGHFEQYDVGVLIVVVAAAHQ